MGFFEKSFDLRKFARAVKTCVDDMGTDTEYGHLRPELLEPCLQKVYIQALREEIITLANIDFEEISENDIYDLENVLHYSPANKLFDICEVFIGLQPAAAVKGAFI